MRPVIIGVGGAHSDSGKTTYAALLLERLKGWGAIKFTKTGLYSSVIDDEEVLSEEGKDTRRMLDAGAERVLWVKAPRSELGEVLSLAVERLSCLRGIVVEGNSAIEFLRPDIIIFIFGDDPGRIKESAKGILRDADVVISGEGNPGMVSDRTALFRKSPSDNERFLTYIADMVTMKEKIRSSLQEHSVHNKISCHHARKIAEELDIPYHEIGKAANELGIKIMACELGCF
jgi:LAO/AO transport system kinase